MDFRLKLRNDVDAVPMHCVRRDVLFLGVAASPFDHGFDGLAVEQAQPEREVQREPEQEADPAGVAGVEAAQQDRQAPGRNGDDRHDRHGRIAGQAEPREGHQQYVARHLERRVLEGFLSQERLGGFVLFYSGAAWHRRDLRSH